MEEVEVVAVVVLLGDSLSHRHAISVLPVVYFLSIVERKEEADSDEI